MFCTTCMYKCPVRLNPKMVFLACKGSEIKKKLDQEVIMCKSFDSSAFLMYSDIFVMVET